MSNYILNNNSSPRLVEGAVDALIAGSGGALLRLDGYDQGVKVVVRSDYENVKDTNVCNSRID